ncbi:MAG: serine/threonine-protein kinase [Candidatus Sumerlaeia bacterium]|nr:serine/threonine-protein kinase [Candidatus Sumerlaeia bacterium]
MDDDLDTPQLPELPDDPRASFNPAKTLPLPTPAQLGFEVDEAEDFDFASAVEDGLPHRRENPFRLKVLLAKGGFGEIWTATQRSLGRTIAVKRLRADLLDPERVPASTRVHLERTFRQEALTAAILDHPNILPIHDLGNDPKGLPQLAMKLVHGRVWEQSIYEDFVSLSVEEFLLKHLPILVGMAQGVAFAHSRGIVHRDLKPSQVMVGEFGEVLLMDWGLAVVYDAKKAAKEGGDLLESGLAPTLETAANPSGTAAFMAPEQTEKTCARIGPHTDVYLLGGTLYYLLTGYTPHEGTTAQESFLKAMSGQVIPPEERATDREIPSELSQLALQAMNPDPRTRVRSAAEFIERVNSYLKGEGRRRESEQLTERAQEMSDEGEPGYSGLAEMDTLLVRARGLWPGNRAAARLHAAVLVRFAEAALANRDLILARTMAGRLENHSLREELNARANGLEAQLDRSGRQRRVLTVASVSLIVAVLVLAIMAGRRAYEADAALEQAFEQRDRADALSNYVLFDLARTLDGIGRLDLLEEGADRALKYMMDSRDTGSGVAALRQRAGGLRAVGDVFRSRGRLEDAISAYRLAHATATRLYATNPLSIETWRDFARSSESLASALERQALYEEAVAELDSALARVPAELLAPVGAQEDEARTREVRAWAGRLNLSRGRNLWRLERPEEAHAAWQLAAAQLKAPAEAAAADAAPGDALGPYAVALLRLRQRDTAELPARRLIDAGWQDGEFLQLALAAGLLDP